MDQTDLPAFLAALNEMGVMFGDEMPHERQRLYWEFFRDQVSLAEWQYAANHAMWRETFHKVPLPAVLMEYVREYRKLHRDEQARMQRQTRQLMSPEESLERVRELLAGVFRDGRLKDPIPPWEQEATP